MKGRVAESVLLMGAQKLVLGAMCWACACAPAGDAAELTMRTPSEAEDASLAPPTFGVRPLNADVDPWAKVDAYLGVAAFSALTLNELGAVETARSTVAYLDETVDVITFDITAFEQNFASGDGEVVRVPWRQRALLCLPSTAARASVDAALVYATHDGDPTAASVSEDWCLNASLHHRMPVLLHGWYPDVVEAVDGRSFHATQEFLLARAMDDLQAVDDIAWDGRHLFDGFVLAKGNVVANTVMQKAVAAEWGSDITRLGTLGISKEGHAQWITAAADPRVYVSAPGGAALQSRAGLQKHFAEDFDCGLPFADAVAPPELHNQIVRWLDWSARTAPGQLLARVTFAEEFERPFLATHFLFSGDLGLHPLFGDGLKQHDWLWPLLTEREGLPISGHPSQRYARVPGASGVQFDGDADLLARSLLFQVGDLLNDVTTPQLRSASATVDAGLVSFTIGAQIAPGTSAEAFLVYTYSEGRALRGPSANWQAAPMTPTAPGTFAVSLPAPTGAAGLTYLFIVLEADARGYVRNTSTLPAEINPVPVATCSLPAWDAP